MIRFSCLIIFLLFITVNANTWDDVTKIVEEPTQRFGLELEWNKMTMAYSHNIQKFVEGGKVKNPTEIDKITEWAVNSGHHVMYNGKGDFSVWEIHLDGDSRCLHEFVSKPLIMSELKSKTSQLITILTSSNKNQYIEFIKENFEVNQEFKAQLDYILLNMEFSVTSKLPDPQVTSTFTISDLIKCKSTATEGIKNQILSTYSDSTRIYKGKEVLFNKPSLSMNSIKHFLSRNLYKEGGKLGTTYLIKHCEEQLGNHVVCGYKSTVEKDIMTKSYECVPIIDDKVIEIPPKPQHFPEKFDKIRVEYKVHCVANKISPLFKRGGELAILVEVRQGVTFRGKDDDCKTNKCAKIQAELDNMFKCVG